MKIQLKAKDGEPITVDAEIVCCSEVIKVMLETLGYTEEDGAIPLDVNHATLKKIIEWATYRKNNPPPGKDDKNKEERAEEISEWNAEFFNVDPKMIIDLTNAANYLNIKELLDVCSTAVANMIRGKSSEEIRNLFLWKEVPNCLATEKKQEKEGCDEK